MNIVSYNVNGIRAAVNKGLGQWISQTAPDIICFQEIKANTEDIPKELNENETYHRYWHPAAKKGYSGVGIMTKIKPNHVEYGCGIERYDREGRVLRADFNDFSIISLYCPSGTTGGERQEFKEQFMADFRPYVNDLLKKFPRLIISGDYNICHKAIDIHNPVSNKNSSGFLPHEREWLSDFMGESLIDSFRNLYPEPHNYTWWSFRAGSRAKNLGWRIDYHLVSAPLIVKVKEHKIHADVMHSDHCPIELQLSI